MSNFFKKLSAARAFAPSKWFTPGMYLVEIQRVVFNTGGFGGDSFVIEGTVLGARPTDDENERNPKAHETCAHVWKASAGKEDMAKNTWMSFLCGVYGCDIGDYNDAQWENISHGACSENNLKGQVMFLECFNKPTRDKKDFTVHAWRRIATAADYAQFGLEAPAE